MDGQSAALNQVQRSKMDELLAEYEELTHEMNQQQQRLLNVLIKIRGDSPAAVAVEDDPLTEPGLFGHAIDIGRRQRSFINAINRQLTELEELV